MFIFQEMVINVIFNSIIRLNKAQACFSHYQMFLFKTLGAVSG